MYYFSFVLLWTLWAVIAIRLRLFGFYVVIALLILVNVWQAAYLAIALRRFYWPVDRRRVVPWIAAIGAGVFLYLLNSAFITGVQLAGGALAIWRL